MSNTDVELAIIKSNISDGTCPVKGVPIDIAYKPGVGWTLLVHNVDILDLGGEDRQRFARWLIDTSQNLNNNGIVTFLERVP